MSEITMPDFWTAEEFFEFQEDLVESPHLLELIALPQLTEQTGALVSVQRVADVVAVVLNEYTKVHVAGIWDICPADVLERLKKARTLRQVFGTLDNYGVNVSAPWMAATKRV